MKTSTNLYQYIQAEYTYKYMVTIMIYMSRVSTYCSFIFLKIFRNRCLKTYDLDLSHIYSAPKLTRRVALTKTNTKLGLLTYIDILLMVVKRIGKRIWQ